MKWHKEELDIFLVPAGLLLMFGYHIWLLYRYLKNYKSTTIGFENHCQKAFVTKIMQVDAMSRGPAFTVISNAIVASNFMAATSLTLSSLIGAWVGGSSSISSTDKEVTRLIYGDTRASITSMKYVSILLFFLLAFAAFIQSSRSYVQANLLLSIPKADVPQDLPVEALVHGANFWQVGLRALYFAITMLMWVFGPIPMFLSSVVMVVVLYFLDYNTKFFHKFHESKSTYRNGERNGGYAMEGNQVVGNCGLGVSAINTMVMSTAIVS